MSRHLFELTSLWGDLTARYGEDDDLVRQVKHEVEALKAQKFEHRDHIALDPSGALPTSARRGREGYSNLLR